MRRILPILILLLTLSAALYAIFAGDGNNGQGEDSATNGAKSQDAAALRAEYANGTMAAFVFDPAPRMAPANQFMGPDGHTYSLGSFKGKVLLVNFWATWCAPCRHEMPDLNNLQATLGGADFEVVTINVDRGDGNLADKFMKEVGADQLTVYRESLNRMAGAYQVIAMPTTFLIDRDGYILGKALGAAEWNSPEAHALIDWALKQ